MGKCSNARFLMPAKPVMHPFDMAALSEEQTLLDNHLRTDVLLKRSMRFKFA